jgi:hypothetical protein
MMKKISNENLKSKIDEQNLVCHEIARSAFEITRTIFWSESSFPPPILNLIHASHSVLYCKIVCEGSYEFYSGWFPLFGSPTQSDPPKLLINNNLSLIAIEKIAWAYAVQATYIYSTKATCLVNTYRILGAIPQNIHRQFIFEIPNQNSDEYH